MNGENSSGLVSLQGTAKILGVTKKDVQGLIGIGSLDLINTGANQYVTRLSISRLLGQNTAQIPSENVNGYPGGEELSCLLPKNDTAENTGKAGVVMEYKGSISTLADGRFMVQIEKGKKANGKRDRESKSFKNKAEAQEYLDSRLVALNSLPPIITNPNGEVAPTDSFTTLTFEQYALKMLQDGLGGTGTRNAEGYRMSLQPTLPYIGKKKMVEIVQQDLVKMFDRLSFQYANSGLSKTYNITKLIIENASDEGDIPSNPIRKVNKPKSKRPKKKAQSSPIYSDDDISLIFKLSKEYSIELYTMFCILECTGMRPGELRGLEWVDFDRKAKTISIKQAATREFEEMKTLKHRPKSKSVISKTKSDYSVRVLPLSDLSVSALEKWKKFVSKSRNANTANSEYIFSSRSTGTHKTEDAINSTLTRFKRLYKLELKGVEITYYKFRHTFCTRLVMEGQPIPAIQRLMGDNTPDVIMKIYTHVNQEMALQATQPFYEKMNERLAKMAI